MQTPNFTCLLALSQWLQLSFSFLFSIFRRRRWSRGTIPFEAEAAAVVVRDEQVVFAQNYGKANYIVSEGERVEAEAPLWKSINGV